MSWTQIRFSPGIVKDRTRYGSENYWYDGSLVRFRNGLPESWKGWQKYHADTLLGKARSLYRHSDNSGFDWLSVGTNLFFYMYDDDTRYEVTPLRKTTNPMSNNPVATTNGSSTVVITDTSHGAYTGNYVILSGLSGPVGGISAAALNTTHILTYVSDNTYSITTSETASSTTTGGGASGVAKYIFHAGAESDAYGGGWGSQAWGEEEWGGDTTSVLTFGNLGIWSHDNWGEDLVACAQDGKIFYWDRTNPSNRMLALRDLAGADGYAPEAAQFILTSHKDRHLIAFGCDTWSTEILTPMLIRWCDQEDILKWDESSTTQTAGSLLAAHGSKLVCGIKARDEILFWSDTTMYALQYIGGDLIFSIQVLAQNTDVAGLKAAEYYNDVVYWMGRTGIYRYTGRVEKVNCPVWDYVERRMNKEQISKVYCATNRKYDEIIWFYPSSGAENDSYVAYNVVDDAWTVGTLSRTAWLDSGANENPVAFDPDSNYLAEHEASYIDEINDEPLSTYIESGPVELSVEGGFDKGDRFVFIRRILPDITFMGVDDGVNTPQATFTIKMMDKPGGGFDSKTDGGAVTRVASGTVETFTDEIHTRLRGRSFTVRVESEAEGTQWRMGVPRFDVRTDGKR